MKKTLNSIFSAAFVVLAVISCTKEQIKDVVANVESLKITALGAKSYLATDANVFWSNSDKLQVFADDYVTMEEFSTTDGGKACSEFYTDSWPAGLTPTYAAHSSAADQTACTSAGVLTVKVNPTQQIGIENSYAIDAAASVGAVTSTAGGYVIEQMKNVAGLVELYFQGGDIAKVVIESLDGSPVAGFVNVDASTMNWTKTSGKAQSSTITLTPAGDAANGDGCFKAGVKYYAAMLPSTYSGGLRFVMTKKDGTKCVRSAVSSFEVKRSDIRTFSSAIDDGAVFETPVMGDPFTLTLDFTSGVWPFTTPCVADSLQAHDGVNGEEYIYHYDDLVYEADFSFTIGNPVPDRFNDDDKYYGIWWYTDKHLTLSTHSSGGHFIKLPAVEGKILQSVTIEINNTADKSWYLSTALGDSGTTIYDGEPYMGSQTASFTTASATKPEAGTSYYIITKNGRKTMIKKIILVYMNNLPEAPVDNRLKIGFTSVSSNPFTGIGSYANNAWMNIVEPETFYLTAYPEYKFVSLDAAMACWNNGQGVRIINSPKYNANQTGKIKFPNISGYKLTSVEITGGTTSGYELWSCKTDNVDTDRTVLGTVYVASSDLGAKNGTSAANALHTGTFTLEDDYDAGTSYYLRAISSYSRFTALMLYYSPLGD